MKAQHYLAWYDDSRKDNTAKIADAVQAFEDRFGVVPSVVLVNAANVAEHPLVTVRVADWPRQHHFMVGFDDGKPRPKAAGAEVSELTPEPAAVNVTSTTRALVSAVRRRR